MHDIQVDLPSNYDSWAMNACMSPHTRFNDIRASRRPRNASQQRHQAGIISGINTSTGAGTINGEGGGISSGSESVLIVNSPDSWSFQHFLDRVTHIVAQASHLTHLSIPPAIGSASASALSSVRPATGRMGNAIVQQMWKLLGFGAKEKPETGVLHSVRGTMSVDRLIFSCKTPLIHPYLSWKAAEMLGVKWSNTWDPPDTSSKKTVFYASRSIGGSATMNGGRRVLNEAQLLDSLRRTLETRGLSEKLELFDPGAYVDVEEMIEVLSRDALAFIGPHGGAMMNHRFAGPGTLVLEFLPTSWFSFINYEEASMLNQTYAAIVVDPEPASASSDMRIDTREVEDILHRYLGKAREDGVTLPYQWLAE